MNHGLEIGEHKFHHNEAVIRASGVLQTKAHLSIKQHDVNYVSSKVVHDILMLWKLGDYFQLRQQKPCSV